MTESTTQLLHDGDQVVVVRLGEAELFQKELLSVDEVLSRLEAVTPKHVHDLARRLFSTPETLAAVGPAR